jgi:hypothetical protein
MNLYPESFWMSEFSKRSAYFHKMKEYKYAYLVGLGGGYEIPR